MLLSIAPDQFDYLRQGGDVFVTQGRTYENSTLSFTWRDAGWGVSSLNNLDVSHGIKFVSVNVVHCSPRFTKAHFT